MLRHWNCQLLALLCTGPCAGLDALDYNVNVHSGMVQRHQFSGKCHQPTIDQPTNQLTGVGAGDAAPAAANKSIVQIRRINASMHCVIHEEEARFFLCDVKHGTFRAD